LDIRLVLAAHELSVDRGLHEFVEEALTENAATEVKNMLVVVNDEVDGAHLKDDDGPDEFVGRLVSEAFSRIGECQVDPFVVGIGV